MTVYAFGRRFANPHRPKTGQRKAGLWLIVPTPRVVGLRERAEQAQQGERDRNPDNGHEGEEEHGEPYSPECLDLINRWQPGPSHLQ